MVRHHKAFRARHSTDRQLPRSVSWRQIDAGRIEDVDFAVAARAEEFRLAGIELVAAIEYKAHFQRFGRSVGFDKLEARPQQVTQRLRPHEGTLMRIGGRWPGGWCGLRL